MQNLGYDKPLYILPFDHRDTIARKFFGKDNTRNLSSEEIHFLREFKMLTYKGFKKALEQGIPKENAAILCDEEFGSEVLIDAKNNGYITILTVEKSGEDKLEFEYEDFKAHIEKFKPTFVKILIRYNPEDSKDKKIYQKEKLKEISDFCHEEGYKFLLEVLVIPTKNQLSLVNQDREDFDIKLRPRLSVEIIKDLQNHNIEPDIWKLEGFDSEFEYQEIVDAIKYGGRDKVGLVILGRGESEEKVDKWLEIGSKVEDVIGFAVGRTVFWEPIEQFYNGKIGKAQVIEEIAHNFIKFYKIFLAS